MKSFLAFKLFCVKKGEIHSLFINKKESLPIGKWIPAKMFVTPGFSPRYGWHALSLPIAPHLSKKRRAWFLIEVSGVSKHTRPLSQGGLWYTADRIRILERLPY